MSCRETGAGSAFTSWARFVHGRAISEPATLATFHRLRNIHLSRDADSQIVHSEEQYRSLLTTMRHRVSTNATLTERERTSILARLDRADSEPMPDQATVYALFNITNAVRNRANSQASFFTDIAQRTGQPRADVERRYRELSASVNRRTASDVTHDDTERAGDLGLPRDAGSVHAMMRLEEEAQAVEITRARQQPQRIARTIVGPFAGTTGDPTVDVVASGYDARTGRLEVEILSRPSDGPATAATLIYRDVPERLGTSASIGQAWYDEVRGNPDYQYPNEHAAALDGVAPRCDNCGQFADAAHACAPRVDPILFSRYSNSGRWTRQRVSVYGVNQDNQPVAMQTSVSLPPIRRIQQAVLERPVNLQISEYVQVPDPNQAVNGRYYTQNRHVSGSFIVTREDRRSPVEVDPSQAACSCQDYRDTGRCAHMDVVVQAIRDRIERPNAAALAERDRVGLQEAVVAASERIQRQREEALATDWTRDPAGAAEAAVTWRRDADVLYSEDPDAFTADIADALARSAAKNGEPDIPFMRENALDGLCARGSGKGFGIELEYEFPSNWSYQQRNEAQQRIGEELFAAGLTYSETMQGYRASQHRGFRDTHTDANGVGNWSWERDGSVDGELVTPVMYDEPETWEKLETALTILRRNGATAGTRSGAHVHVGTGEFRGSPAAYTELARLVTQHEDVLVRLASNPARGTHRNNGYSTPLPVVPATGFRDVSEARNWQNRGPGRYATVNLANCQGGSGDHPEFRVFDSTLDPGSVQAQVKLAVAITSAAQRNAEAGGTTRGKEAWGMHVRRTEDPLATPSSPEEIAEDSGTVRSLLDTLFRRREDKAQFASVFAATRWSSPSARH